LFSRQLPQNGTKYELPDSIEPGEWTIMFRILGDESGKMNPNTDRTSFCGYVAHQSIWEAFSVNWNACRFKWGLPPIHMARITKPENKNDDWKKLKEQWGETIWNKKIPIILSELQEIIRESRIACVGAVVDCQRFRELAAKDKLFKKAYKNPIHMAFHFFIMGAMNKIEAVDKSTPIGVVVDNDKEFAMACYKQLESLKSMADFPNPFQSRFAVVKERVHSMCFVDDTHFPGVQAADMIAYEARRIMVERMTNPEATSEMYNDLTFMGIHQPGFYDAKTLDELAATNPVTEDTPDE
jgi:Protein of unknown function (DUF3800)